MHQFRQMLHHLSKNQDMLMKLSEKIVYLPSIVLDVLQLYILLTYIFNIFLKHNTNHSWTPCSTLYIISRCVLYAFELCIQLWHKQYQRRCAQRGLVEVEEDRQHYQVHPLSWLLVPHSYKAHPSNRLLLSNQEKVCT